MNIKFNTKSFLYRTFAVFIIVMVGLAALPVKSAYAAACTFTSTGSGDWTTLAWNRTGTNCSTYPGQTFAGDTVTISGGNAVTLNVSPPQTIGTITINGSTANNGTQPTLLNVGAGTLSAASIALNPSNNNLGSTNRRVEITISTGTVNVTGNITTPNVTNGTGTGVLFTGNGSVNIGGTFLSDADALFTPSTGTINYNGAVQTVKATTYNNLILSGSGAKTMSAGTSVTGNLSIAPVGTATASIVAGQNLSVGTLRLGGLGRINGTWGGTGSGATYINTTYFAATTGRLTVGTATRVAASVTTWPTATGITSGQSLASSTLSGGVSPIPGAFAFTAPATIPPVGTYSASVTFTPTDATSYTSVTGTVNVVVTAVVVGNTYYVNKDNLSCSDTLNNGLTPAAPFCTIFKGSAMANSAGNTVRVLAGTYAETVTPTGSGSAGNPITFSANPGVTVTGAPGYGFRVSGRSYITIDGFNVTGTSNIGISVATSDHVIISNNHVSLSGSPVNGSTRAGINFDTTTNSTISGNTTDHNSSYGIYLSGASNGNTVSDNISFANAQGWQRVATGINVYASNNNTILHNTTYANEDSGIQLYAGSTGNSVIGNLTYGNADHGI